MCGKVIYPPEKIATERNETGPMSYHLNPIPRLNFTEEERAEMDRRANIEGRHKRELGKEEARADFQNKSQNIPKIIPKGEDKEMSTKRCNKCGKEKNTDDFSKNHTTPDGYDRTCRSCLADLRAARKKAKARNDKKADPAPVNPKKSLGESLYMDPAAIRSIKRSIGKENLREFSTFLDRRYA